MSGPDTSARIPAVVWFTLWFMVILKIPILYLAWVIWWAVKDPPEAWAEGHEAEPDGGGPGWRPRDRRGRRGGPHGTRSRRPLRTRLARV
jgi:hypothetical protein